MATFRIGQRVRIIGARFCPEYIGKEATIVGPLESRMIIDGSLQDVYRLDVDGIGERHLQGVIGFPPAYLAPLTGPWATNKVEELKLLLTKPKITEKELA